MTEAEELANRYQNQSWWVRRWRDRWLLAIPFFTLWWWILARFQRFNPSDVDIPVLWSIACGWIDHKREYWYTSEEFFGKRRSRCK